MTGLQSYELHLIIFFIQVEIKLKKHLLHSPLISFWSSPQIVTPRTIYNIHYRTVVEERVGNTPDHISTEIMHSSAHHTEKLKCRLCFQKLFLYT